MNVKHVIEGRWVRFEAVSEEPITQADAMLAQERAGYHPAGYNFQGFLTGRDISDRFKASWVCYANCD